MFRFMDLVAVPTPHGPLYAYVETVHPPMSSGDRWLTLRPLGAWDTFDALSSMVRVVAGKERVKAELFNPDVQVDLGATPTGWGAHPN